MWTAAVRDVQYGAGDMGAGVFWITQQRSGMSGFTVPISEDRVHLWVQRPQRAQSSLYDESGARAAHSARMGWPPQPVGATEAPCDALEPPATRVGSPATEPPATRAARPHAVRVFLPFENALWYTLLGLVGMAALVKLYIHADWRHAVDGHDEWLEAVTWRQKARVVGREGLAGFESHEHTNVPAMIAQIGFAFFVLISTSAYTCDAPTPSPPS
jgi:hypothetical protein